MLFVVLITIYAPQNRTRCIHLHLYLFCL